MIGSGALKVLLLASVSLFQGEPTWHAAGVVGLQLPSAPASMADDDGCYTPTSGGLQFGYP